MSGTTPDGFFNHWRSLGRLSDPQLRSQRLSANPLPGAANNHGTYIDDNGVPSLFRARRPVGNYFQQPGGTAL